MRTSPAVSAADVTLLKCDIDIRRSHTTVYDRVRQACAAHSAGSLRGEKAGGVRMSRLQSMVAKSKESRRAGRRWPRPQHGPDTRLPGSVARAAQARLRRTVDAMSAIASCRPPPEFSRGQTEPVRRNLRHTPEGARRMVVVPRGSPARPVRLSSRRHRQTPAYRSLSSRWRTRQVHSHQPRIGLRDSLVDWVRTVAREAAPRR